MIIISIVIWPSLSGNGYGSNDNQRNTCHDNYQSTQTDNYQTSHYSLVPATIGSFVRHLQHLTLLTCNFVTNSIVSFVILIVISWWECGMIYPTNATPRYSKPEITLLYYKSHFTAPVPSTRS